MSPKALFFDQISRFAFGLAAVAVVMLLLEGEDRSQLLFLVSVISFTSMIVRWGVDHNFYVKLISSADFRARSMTVNGSVVSFIVFVFAFIAIFFYLYIGTRPTEFSTLTLLLLSASIVQQVASPIEVYQRVNAPNRKPLPTRLFIQTAALLLKYICLSYASISTFALITFIESLLITFLYFALFKFRSKERRLIRFRLIVDQLMDGSIWGVVAVFTMLLSVMISSAAESSLPPDQASVFLFCFRIFGAVNNVVSAATIAVTQKIIAIKSIDQSIVGVCVLSLSVTLCFIAFFLFSTSDYAPIDLNDGKEIWLLSSLGMAAALPISVASAVSGRILALEYGAKISLQRISLATGLIYAIRPRIIELGIIGNIIIVLLSFSAIVFFGLVLWTIRRFIVKI